MGAVLCGMAWADQPPEARDLPPAPTELPLPLEALPAGSVTDAPLPAVDLPAKPDGGKPAPREMDKSATWAENLTLAPGDGVNITVFGQPTLARNEMVIRPDGRISYLQAQNVMAAGLTIDQLRETLNAELRRWYKNYRVIVTPYTFQSRKIYILGKIVKKGAVNLDRPMSLVEAVSEAGGLETGLFQQNTVELADLGRSFLVRGGKRVAVDLEALFLRGDMTQNIPVQPDDYLYFPSANANEIYVLGNVKMQGTQGLLAHTSVHSAIAQAGGFTPLAYRQRVLVVRGALTKPERFVVNMNEVLAGREKGFRLEPKDIVFVADRPWAKAEELLDTAITAFLQSAVATWTGANIGPFIKRPFLPQLKDAEPDTPEPDPAPAVTTEPAVISPAPAAAPTTTTTTP